MTAGAFSGVLEKYVDLTEKKRKKPEKGVAFFAAIW